MKFEPYQSNPHRGKIIGYRENGWAVQQGEILNRGPHRRVVAVGREGNLILARPTVQAHAVLPASALASTIELQRIHPSELGVKSNVTLPDYVKDHQPTS